MLRRTLLVLTVVCAPLMAKKPAPLPDFTLIAPDGKAVRSSQLKLNKNWLLVYVHTRSAHSVTMLNQLKDDNQLAANQKVIVIVGGATTAQAAELMSGYAHLKSVTWYSEPRRDALHKLDLPGAPAVLGMKDDISQWRFVGETARQQHLQSLMKSWRDKDK